MYVEEFIGRQWDDVAAQWEQADGVGLLVSGEVCGHHLRVLKHTAGYLLLAFCPLYAVRLDADVDCGCPLADRLHHHTWQSYETAREAATAMAAAVSQARSGAGIRLEHSCRYPF